MIKRLNGPLFMQEGTHWLCFIYKVLLGLAPTYSSVLLTKNHGHYGLRSNDLLNLVVPGVKTELGKKSLYVCSTFSLEPPSEIIKNDYFYFL